MPSERQERERASTGTGLFKLCQRGRGPFRAPAFDWRGRASASRAPGRAGPGRAGPRRAAPRRAGPGRTGGAGSLRRRSVPTGRVRPGRAPVRVCGGGACSEEDKARSTTSIRIFVLGWCSTGVAHDPLGAVRRRFGGTGPFREGRESRTACLPGKAHPLG